MAKFDIGSIDLNNLDDCDGDEFVSSAKPQRSRKPVFDDGSMAKNAKKPVEKTRRITTDKTIVYCGDSTTITEDDDDEDGYPEGGY